MGTPVGTVAGMATKRRAPGEGGLFKRADGMWVGRVDVPTADGRRRRRVVYSRDKAVAAEKLRKLRNDVAEGRVSSSPTMTLGAWLDQWLDIHGPHVRPTTRRHHEQSIRLYIKPHIGDRRLDKLTLDDVEKMLRAVAARSTKSAQKAHQTLSQALKEAERRGLVYRNVAAIVRKPRHTPRQREALTVDQARHIISTAIDLEPAAGPHLATRWAAAFLTGARQAELLGLTWDRVDLDAGTIDLAWQLQQLQHVHGCGEPDDDGEWPCGRVRPGWCPSRRWELPAGFEHKVVHRSLAFTRPKTRAGTRIVPLAEPLRLMLVEHAKRSGPNPHNLVWHYPDGRPIGPRDDLHAWRVLLAAAGVDPVPLHSARHTTATLLLAAGVDAHVVSAILGHSDVIVTRGYQHVDLTLARQAAGQLTRLLS
ncbi:tyrosine integrase [Mycobacterium phage Fionnbharth]|uniref:Integrase n=1 Tax=Mycobacterium phage Fionnbharth TaxID=2923006 RepID=G8IR34_9CAUD|nr:endonuclease [Mycobacterium phage Fionnbharth]AER26336.1 tyrosine integrase [Mycobacterium phage Fionnbharth]